MWGAVSCCAVARLRPLRSTAMVIAPALTHSGHNMCVRRGARDLEALKTFVEEQATELLAETTE